MNEEKIISIPGRLKSVAEGTYVAGTEDIYDDQLMRTQKQINSLSADNERTLKSRMDLYDEHVTYSIDGGDRHIATAEDFDYSTAEHTAKIPTVLSILDWSDENVVKTVDRDLTTAQLQTAKQNLGMITEIVHDITLINGSDYADVSAAINAVPSALRIGGVSIKFSNSTTGKYETWTLTSGSWSDNTADWQGVDEEPVAGSENLVKSGGVFRNIFFINVNGVNNNSTTSYTLESAIVAVPESLRKPYAYIAYRMEGQKFGFAQFKGSIVGDNYSYWLDINYWQDDLTNIKNVLETLTDLTSRLEIQATPYGEYSIPETTVINGKFISNAGALEENSAYNISTLTMSRGEVLVIKSVASSSVAAIAVKNGSTYTVKKLGKDGNTYSIYYILIGEQSEVYISYRNADNMTPTIYKSSITDITDEITLNEFETIVGTLDAQKYIDPAGNYSSNANFGIYTINLTAGDYLLAELSASSSIAVISEVNNNTYIPKVIGADGSKYLLYKYLAVDNVTVAVCGKYYADKSYVIKTYKKQMSEFLKINKKDIDEMKEKYPLFISSEFIENSDGITAETISGSYIAYDGSIGTASSYSRTNPFTVEAGKTVVLKCSAGTGCAVIAEFDDETLTYNPIKIGTSSQYYFSYTPVRNTKVVLSFRNTEEYYYSLSDITADAISTIRSEYLEREDYLKYFNSILCIGDSVTAGAVADYPRTTGATAEDAPQFSYPTQLEKITGVDVVNAGVSGYSPKNWYDNKINQYTYTDYNLVLIELGYNGGMEDTLSTDVIPYNDYHDYADTPCGNYCKIIKAIQAENPSIMIVLVISAGMNMTRTEVPPTIKHIASLFGLPYIDLRSNLLENLNDNKFHGFLSGGSRDMIHFNPIGYMAKAILIKRLLSKVVYDNIATVNNSVPIEQITD